MSNAKSEKVVELSEFFYIASINGGKMKRSTANIILGVNLIAILVNVYSVFSQFTLTHPSLFWIVVGMVCAFLSLLVVGYVIRILFK